MNVIFNEEWKDIDGYEGFYQISNYGRVKSLERFIKRKNKGTICVEEKILKPNYARKGYQQVALCKYGTRKMYLVNRLVAIAFIPNPNNYPHAGHWDDDKDNNTVSNIYWTTASENNYHNGKSAKVMAKRSKPLIGISINGEDNIKFRSFTDAQNNKFYSQGIFNNIKGKTKHYKGYIWKYAS